MNIDPASIKARHPLDNRTLYEGHVLIDLWDALEEVTELHRQHQMVLNHSEGVSISWKKGDLVECVLANEARQREALLREVAAWLEDHDYIDASTRIVKELTR
jgi:hypothetical protein